MYFPNNIDHMISAHSLQTAMFDRGVPRLALFKVSGNLIGEIYCEFFGIMGAVPASALWDPSLFVDLFHFPAIK